MDILNSDLVAKTIMGVVGAAVTMLLGIITYFMRDVLNEQKALRKDLTNMHLDQVRDEEKFHAVQDQLIVLQKSDTELMKKLTEAIERLTRLEERSRRHEHE